MAKQVGEGCSMKTNGIKHKILYVSLCIGILFFFTQNVPVKTVNVEVTEKTPYETSHNKNEYGIGSLSLDQLLGLGPKKINEFVEQHIDEELDINEIISYFDCIALLDYLKALQKVLFQMFICLITIAAIHRSRKKLLSYIYNKDRPRRSFLFITEI